jgi:hypothetical protein
VASDDADGEMLLNDNCDQQPPSWASAEQARFLAHVHLHPDTAKLGQS